MSDLAAVMREVVELWGRQVNILDELLDQRWKVAPERRVELRDAYLANHQRLMVLLDTQS